MNGKTLVIVAGLLVCAPAPATARTEHRSRALPGALGRHRFMASETGAPRIALQGKLQMTFGPFKITCLKAKAAGGRRTIFPALALTIPLSPNKCTSEAVKIGKLKVPVAKIFFSAPIAVTYHANGYAEIQAGGKTPGGTVKLTVPAAEYCAIELPAQATPAKAPERPTEEYEAASFEDIEVKTENLKSFPSGLQEKLLLTNAFEKLSYTLTGEPCDELSQTSGKDGTIAGALLAELRNGDLGWE